MCAKSEKAACGAHHVFADAGLADVDAEFEQFAVNAGCTPSGILAAHPAGSDLGPREKRRASGLAAPNLPGPEQAKTLAMPGHDRFGLHDDQRRAPIAPEAGQPDPEKAIHRGQFRAFPRRTLKHADLVAQGQIFELEVNA